MDESHPGPVFLSYLAVFSRVDYVHSARPEALDLTIYIIDLQPEAAEALPVPGQTPCESPANRIVRAHSGLQKLD